MVKNSRCLILSLLSHETIFPLIIFVPQLEYSFIYVDCSQFFRANLAFVLFLGFGLGLLLFGLFWRGLFFLFCLRLVVFGSRGIVWFSDWFWLVVVVRICSRRLPDTFGVCSFCGRKAFPN